MAERLMQERAAANAVELLQERWRMIMFMYDDCMDMVKQWEDHRLQRKERRRKRRLVLLSVLALPVAILIFATLLTRLVW
jgi:hypothetical protein